MRLRAYPKLNLCILALFFPCHLLVLFQRATAKERPNIILVMADDLGWGDVGFNGGKQIQTPHLDEMAFASLKFNRFYAQSPVCSPTRGSCLTGRHPYRYGIPFANAGHMKEEEWTLPELLRPLGYRTGHFGKWHLGTLTTEIRDSNRGRPNSNEHFSPPQRNGFDVCFATEAKVPTYDPMFKPPGKAGDAWDSIQDLSEAVSYGTRYWNHQGRIVEHNLRGDDSRIIMDRAVEFIESCVADERAFLAVIWFHAPHLPVVAGPKHRAIYSEVEDVRRRNYFACVTALDEQMGRLRRVLRSSGIEGDTMLAFCSDNGPEGDSQAPGSAGPFRGRKRSLYEGGIRVPGLIEWPSRIPAGSETDFPAVTSDYLPTIVDYLEIRLPYDRPLDGISLRKVFEDASASRGQSIGFESRGQVAWNSERYKIYRAGKNRPWELYDLLADPGEKENIADAKPHVLESMRQDLLRWQSSCSTSSQGGDYKR